MAFVFDPAPTFAVPIAGHNDQFPVNRIFCVGRNYAAHAKEMGTDVDREAPWYFTKTPSNACLSGRDIPYPQGTSNFHHEMELAIFLTGGGQDISPNVAQSVIFGYGCALDMTRRDLQQNGKDHRRPWSLGKDLENGTVFGDITPEKDFGTVGDQSIALHVNGEIRQHATLADMVWTVTELICHLSKFYTMQAGDVILTGTPAGVGAVSRGDTLKGSIAGLEDVRLSLT